MKSRKIFFILLAFLCVFSMDSYAGKRRPAARAAFVREHPCPATGQTKGACRGWQVDHITPLKCGGADAPYNMQWLTVAAHKEKTKREAALCRRSQNLPRRTKSVKNALKP